MKTDNSILTKLTRLKRAQRKAEELSNSLEQLSESKSLAEEVQIKECLDECADNMAQVCEILANQVFDIENTL